MLGNIYIIQSPNTDKVYIGSTFQTLEIRFRNHKYDSNQTNSYLVIDEGDSFIELLEEIKVIDKRELEFYEQQYLELYRDIAVNEQNAFGVDKEKIIISNAKSCKKYYEKNPEKVREKYKKYYEKNREKFQEKFECICGGRYTGEHKSSHLKTQKHQKFLENVAQQ